MPTSRLTLLPVLLPALLLSGCNKPETTTTQTTQTTETTQTTQATETTQTAQTSTDAASTSTSTETASTASTATAGGEAAGGCMERIRKDGLRVITSPDYPPYESLDDSNAIVGFDVDLVNLLADKAGIKATFTGQGFDGLIPSLKAGQADLIAAGMSVTDERKQSVAFTDSYESTKNVIVTKKDDATIKDEATLSGKSVGVQLGTVQETMAGEIEGAEVKTFNTFSEALMALKSGQIDSMMVDEPVGNDYAKVHADLKVAGELPGSDKAFAAPLECTDLVAELNAALATVQQNGELQAISDKWFKKAQ